MPERGAAGYLLGRSSPRDGQRGGETTRSVEMRGIRMEPLDSVDVLLRRPWSTRIVDSGDAFDVRVVHPVDFAVQKLLFGRSEVSRSAKGPALPPTQCSCSVPRSGKSP
ncbi:MAG: GSU2403 family nucleotidyltransferase fold protein [Planctomycetota bacterium]